MKKDNVHLAVIDEEFPSQDFGEAAGIDWIWKEWKLPKGMDEHSLGKMLQAEMFNVTYRNIHAEASKKVIGKVFKDLVKLNPELKGMKASDDIWMMYDWCRGIVSRFNKEDIEFYVSMTLEQKMEHNKKMEGKNYRIAKAVGGYPGWVMSPKTMHRVMQELDLLF